MSEITTIGLDLAKHVFQVHGIDAQGTTVLRKRLETAAPLFSVKLIAAAVHNPAEMPRSRRAWRKANMIDCPHWRPILWTGGWA